MSALGYELSVGGSTTSGLLSELGGEFEMEWARMSPSRLEIQCAKDPEIPAFAKIQIIHYPSQHIIWIGWLVRKTITTAGARLTFVGPREILRNVTLQAGYPPGKRIGAVFTDIIYWGAKELSSAGSRIAIDVDPITKFPQSCPVFTSLLIWNDAPAAADMTDELERLAPGYRAAFYFDPESPTPRELIADMIATPRDVLLVDASLQEFTEEYEGITNRLMLLMSDSTTKNLIPNGDFTRAVLTTPSTDNLVANPSFESLGTSWDLPDSPFYYEWSTQKYTGSRSFKFHDCAEYSPTAWLISSRFNVEPEAFYIGGFAYGCDPYLALECGGPSTVKLKVEVRGYTALGTYTETPVSIEISGADHFHNSLHWHWVDIPSFQFTNSSTAQAEIRFLTFHGKRLYLDEVQIRKQFDIMQEGWELVKTGSANITRTSWFSVGNPGVLPFQYIYFMFTAPGTSTVSLQQTDNSIARFLPNRPLVLRIYSSAVSAAVYIEWRDKNNNTISTQQISMTQSFYEHKIFWWYLLQSNAIIPPSNAVGARVILRWSNVNDPAIAAIRAIYLGYHFPAVAPAWGYQPSNTYDSDTITYPAEADPEVIAEAQNSVNLYGRAPAKIVVHDVKDEETAQEFAKWYFLRRAVPARTLLVRGAGIDDVRIFEPALYRWRVAAPVTRSWIVENLVLRHDGTWEARLGEYEPPVTELMRRMFTTQ